MRTMLRCLGGISLLSVGYFMGATGAFSPLFVHAQPPSGEPEAGEQLSDDTLDKIRAAHTAMQDAMNALEQDGRYNSVTQQPNTFLILSGGGDALQDLESGQGVDPETFAALYADQATDEVAKKLSRDENRRLTYDGRLVRMYPISRLRQIYARRGELASGDDL